ncbi:MAG: insulinase family protein [Lachnospiraceae bacterium]|nr:insulinase family protein [Lachnospiraceae bacterium]
MKSYKLIMQSELSDINSIGYLYKHIKSGAKIAVIKNDDENKVFSVNFRTPPCDSTGTPHIIEHSVLCGSSKYPVKDPFVELAKGSLNTFLNAMTFSDKTMYPVASCNNKDFDNLMGVYLDAVFYPDMKKRREIFEQEGWHYEMESADSPLTINGVVYNEMRGVFSSPDQQLERLIQKTLFPDTPYGYESGGDPDSIPELSYEKFVEEYSKYYHPSNSYIYLYGDIDIDEKLQWIDREYLSGFDELKIDSVIDEQKPFDAMQVVDEKYSAQTASDKAYFSYNWVVGNALDNEIQVAFQVLSYALVSVPGAPLKKALTDAGIGEEISCMFDGEILQPTFSVFAREADAGRKEDFINIITETLETIISGGIDKKSLEAAISYYEFKYREADFGRYPKGLMYGINMMQTWLYDENEPFAALCLNDTFKTLKERVDTGYFEGLVEKYLLKNSHKAVVNVFPEIGLSTKKDEALAKKLKEYKESLSEKEVEQIVHNTAGLKTYQETPDSPEALLCIPLLKREDIEKKAPKIYNEKKEISNITVLHHNLFTNGIAYIDLAFDVTEYKEYAPYIGILSVMLGSIDTVNYSYLELSNEINLCTGGINTSAAVSAMKGDCDDFKIMFEVSTRVLYTSMNRAFELIIEIIKGSLFSDRKRLREVLFELRSEFKASLEASGNATAVDRALSYNSESMYYQNQITGVSFYRLLDGLCNDFDNQCGALIDILEAFVYKIFNKKNLIVSITADDEGYRVFEEESFEVFEALYEINDDSLPALPGIYSPQRGVLNEGFKTSGKVQYVARTGNFIKKGCAYTGALKVLRTILNYGYLWQNIRILGGAYGAMSGFTRSGNAYFASYRDPKLAETNDVYDAIPEYLESFDAGEREMTKYIIGTMSDVDMPLTPRARGRLAFNMYISGVSEYDLQKERDEILSVTSESIRQCGSLVKAVLDCGNVCVVGSDAAIEGSREMFGKIENLS